MLCFSYRLLLLLASYAFLTFFEINAATTLHATGHYLGQKPSTTWLSNHKRKFFFFFSFPPASQDPIKQKVSFEPSLSLFFGGGGESKWERVVVIFKLLNALII